MPVVLGSLLFRRGTRCDSAVATVVADMVDRDIVNYRGVVDVVNVGDVHVQHSAVVEEMAAIPAPTHEAHPEVAESITDPAVGAQPKTCPRRRSRCAVPNTLHEKQMLHRPIPTTQASTENQLPAPAPTC